MNDEMSERKTVGFDWQFGHEEVVLRVATYRINRCLYVGLSCKTEEGFEPLGDVTVNLPINNRIPLKPNEAYINGDFSASTLAFIQKHELGEILPEKGYSGYGEYSKVAFNMERLKEFDPKGVERHMKQFQQTAEKPNQSKQPDSFQTHKRAGR